MKLLADGFEKALLGVVRRFNETWALYDYELCVDVLREDGMSDEEATDYMEFNVIGAFVGRGTPAFAVLGDEGMEMLREGGPPNRGL